MADDYAARAVFQERPGPITAKLLALKNDPQTPVAMRAAMTFVMPFIKTPANILRQGAEFSPLGFVMRAAQQDGRAGSQALGRAAMGTAAMGSFAYLAASGRLTGFGPTNPGERAAFMESGKRPNSIRIRLTPETARELQKSGVDVAPTAPESGEFWVNYQLFQPFSVQLAAIGNAWERFSQGDRSDRAAEESLMAALTGAAASFLDQSFLNGVNDLLDAISDPERNARRVLSTFAQGLVPGSGLLRNVAQAVDPVVRQPEGVVESVKTIIPGVSAQVPPRLGRFGQAITRPGGPLRRGFLVPEISEEVPDRVSALLARVGVNPTLPRGSITVRGESLPLTQDQQRAVIEAVGRERRARLERILALPNVDRMPEGRLTGLVRRALSDATDVVHARVKGRHRAGLPISTETLLSATHATQE
jgi:hypothetical protein